MVIKVLVTGPFSTGKTELVTDVVAALKAINVRVLSVPDAARSCPLPLNEDQTQASSMWLAMTQISLEVAASTERGEVIICDRGIPDIMAHTDDIHTASPYFGITTLRPFLLEWCATYHLILVSEIDESVRIAPDGLRSELPSYRTRLGQRSRALLAEIGTGNVLPFGRLSRSDYALTAIRQLLTSCDPNR